MRLPYAIHLLVVLTVFAAACSGESPGCKTDNDCDENQVCATQSGKCRARCSCLVEDECTATSPECAPSEVVTADGDEVIQCKACVFQSDCDDDNSCTKDSCVDGCCSTRVFTADEAVGCCIEVGNCIDIMNPLASPEDPDADPCTVDMCIDFHCVHEVQDPVCCHNDFECTD
jgi:hypothetical protein